MSDSNGNPYAYRLPSENGAKAKKRPDDVFAEAQKHHHAQRFADAERLYRDAVDADETHVAAWYHLALVCLAQDKLSEAANGFQRVLELDPRHVESLTQLAVVLARQNRLVDAVTNFRRAIELKPDHAKAHNNLGVALTQLGQRDEGFACYREAVRLQPDYAEAQFNLAVALADRKQNEEAIAAYEAALKARPDYVDVLYNLGLLLVNEQRAGEAVVCLEQAVRLKPGNPEAHNNLSVALAEFGRFDDAVASCDAALRIRPLDAKSHMNRANALSSIGRIDEAVASYDFALRLQPDYVNVRWNRSLAYLARGDFQRGWAEYEWRWKRTETKSRHLPEPRWDGGPIDGKTILLWCEQGVGDTIQFVRYAGELKKRGASVWLECPGNLVPVLSTCPSIDRVLAEGSPLPPGFDCHAPLMSLPLGCGTKLVSVPREIPYLFADTGEIEHWRQKLAPSKRFKIGITWQGNPKHRWDRHRSYSLQWFRSLALLDGVELFSLQKGVGTEQLAEAAFPITDLRQELEERGGGFEHTAAAIKALDLIVTCDSAVAHLAGALGVPVWVPMSLLSDWRWLRDREDTPWYPTMRLFRQSTLGDWRSVFDRMAQEVKTLAPNASQSGDRSDPRNKIVSWPALLEIRAKARAVGKKVVWTNGCFDLLHVGHVRNLRAAKNFGDLLIVGVNSDDSVRRLKGKHRPAVPAAERMEVLASLAYVDFVVGFDEDTPLEAIQRLRPDIHCKGADYAPPGGKPIPEAEVVKNYGGRIEFLPLEPGVSTSELIDRIQHDGRE